MKAGPQEHSLDLSSAKKNDEHWLSLKQDIAQLVHDIHTHPDAKKSHEVNKIYQKNKAKFQQIDEKIEQTTTAYIEAKKELVPLIKTQIKTIATRLSSDIDTVLHHYKKSQGSLNLSEGDKKALEQSAARMEHLKVSLQSAENSSTLQHIENEIVKETHLIRQFLSQSILAHQVEEQVPSQQPIAELSSDTIHQELTGEEPVQHPAIGLEEQSSKVSEGQPTTSQSPPPVMRQSSPEAPSMEPPKQEIPVINISQQPQANTAPPVQKTLVEEQAVIPVTPKDQSVEVMVKHQHYRAAVNLLRGGDPVIALFKDLKSLINKRLKNEDLDEEEKDLLTEVLTQITTNEDPENVSKDELLALNDTLKALKEINPHFEKPLSRLEEIIDSITSTFSIEK
jgi:hypothetical protein